MSAQINTRVVFWLCFAIAAVDGFDTLVVSFIAPAFAAEWSLSEEKVGQVFGIGLLGAALGGVIAGRLADRFGRRRILLGSLVWFASLTFICAWSPSADVLMALRFAVGLGLGGAIPPITAIVAEMLPPEKRVASVTRMFLGFPIGAVVGGAISALLVEAAGWRSTFILGGTLGLVLVPLVAAYVREPAKAPDAITLGLATKHAKTRSARGLLASTDVVSAAALWTAAFMILLVSYFLINWTPSILVAAGIPQQQAILGGVVLNLGGVVGAIILTFVVRRIPPFRLAGSILVAGGALIILLGQQVHIVALVTAIVFLVGMTIIGGQLALPALASSLFDRSVRGTGVGLTMGIGRAGSIVGPSVGGILVGASLGWPVLFAIVAVPAVVAGLALLIVHMQQSRSA